MTSEVSSDAAIGTLTVGSNVIEKDIVLHLLCHIITSTTYQLQWNVLTNKKEANTPPSLVTLKGNTLTQRNSILRCLCGIGLCNAFNNSPYYFLGGNKNDSMAIANITSWMSVVVSSSNSSEDKKMDYEKLNAHLQTNAFLIPNTTTCTIADLDVSLWILTNQQQQQDIVASYPNIQRWLQQCHAMATKYAATTSTNTSTNTNTKITIPPLFSTPKKQPPQFFYPGDAPIAVPSANKKQPQSQNKKGGADNKQQPPNNDKKDKKKQPKQENKQQQQPQGGGDAETYDISALDIRIGKIVKIWNHPEADKLYCEEIDLGPELGVRQIASGLRPFYKTPEELLQKHVIVLCNLKKRNLVGFPSHGMVLCASNKDHTQVQIVIPPGTTPVLGERVLFDNEAYRSKPPEPENKINKKKIFEKVAPDLKTDANGVVVWKDAKAITTQGILEGCMPDAQVA